MVYQIYTSRQAQDPELQADKYNCLFNTINRMCNESLILNVSKTEILSILWNSISFVGFINSVMKVLDF